MTAIILSKSKAYEDSELKAMTATRLVAFSLNSARRSPLP